MTPRVWLYGNNGTVLRAIEREAEGETEVLIIAPHGVRRLERFSNMHEAAAFRRQVDTFVAARGYTLMWSSVNTDGSHASGVSA